MFKIFAIAFMVVGIIVFAIIYEQTAQGNFMEVIKNPVGIFVLIMPFIPAVVLSLMATHFDNQFAQVFAALEAKWAAKKKKEQDELFDKVQSGGDD